MWNKTVSIINNPLTPEDVKSYGKMILSQYNTAGGKSIMKPVLEAFCDEHNELAKTLWVIREGEELRLSSIGGNRYTFYNYPSKTDDIKAFNKKYKVERFITLTPEQITFKDFIE